MRNDRSRFSNWGEARPSQGTWDVSLRNTPLHNAYQKCRKRLPCAEGFLSLHEQVAIKVFALSPRMCYAVDAGVRFVFKCWEEVGGGKPLPLQCHTDMAILFCMVDLAQLVQTWGFLLRTLLSNRAMSWPEWQLHLIPVRIADDTTVFARPSVWGTLHLLHSKEVEVIKNQHG